MMMFDLDEDTMINLESINYIQFRTVEGQKTVVAGLQGQSFIIPLTKHKPFFEQIVRLGATPTKQFVSL